MRTSMSVAGVVATAGTVSRWLIHSMPRRLNPFKAVASNWVGYWPYSRYAHIVFPPNIVFPPIVLACVHAYTWL